MAKVYDLCGLRMENDTFTAAEFLLAPLSSSTNEDIIKNTIEQNKKLILIAPDDLNISCLIDKEDTKLYNYHLANDYARILAADKIIVPTEHVKYRMIIFYSNFGFTFEQLNKKIVVGGYDIEMSYETQTAKSDISRILVYIGKYKDTKYVDMFKKLMDYLIMRGHKNFQFTSHDIPKFSVAEVALIQRYRESNIYYDNLTPYLDYILYLGPTHHIPKPILFFANTDKLHPILPDSGAFAEVFKSHQAFDRFFYKPDSLDSLYDAVLRITQMQKCNASPYLEEYSHLKKIVKDLIENWDTYDQ